MIDVSDIPPPPEKPDANECCGSGCVPCIYDYYYDQLACWEERYQLTLMDYLRNQKAAQ